ncbi:phosphatidylserine/phosphatidylglycerophosphate/cardiolipin synthase family protein [Vreelandella glaciei]|uniref:phospholipase D-like domain-containing protein n=1 Tax=Vreelandella glaciei TaxID=186761 RepID=UPI0030033943
MEPTWREGNRIQLLPKASCYVPALLDAVVNAKESILFEQYLVASGNFVNRVFNALCDASNRGVQVFVLFDAYGAQELDPQNRQQLEQAGVVLREFNPPFNFSGGSIFARDHRKLLLVDSKVAFTGGFCITDEFLGEWYDVVVRIEGPVVQDWLSLFIGVWESKITKGAETAPPFEGAKHSIDPRFLGSSARVIWGRGYRQQAIRLSLLQQIESAQQRICLCTPYFLPTPSLKRTLAAAAKRGVSVQLMVAGKDHDHPTIFHAGRRHYRFLINEGVQIYEYSPRFIHAKYAVVDNWVTIGSCNFDHWSLRWNLEANQEVSDAEFAGETRRLFAKNSAASEKIDPAKWASRPYYQKLKEAMAGMLTAYLTRLR